MTTVAENLRECRRVARQLDTAVLATSSGELRNLLTEARDVIEYLIGETTEKDGDYPPHHVVDTHTYYRHPLDRHPI